MSEGKNLYAYVIAPTLSRKFDEAEKPLAEKSAHEMASACTALFAVNPTSLGPILEKVFDPGPDAAAALKDYRLLVVAVKEKTAITIKTSAPVILPLLTVLKEIFK